MAVGAVDVFFYRVGAAVSGVVSPSYGASVVETYKIDSNLAGAVTYQSVLSVLSTILPARE